MARGREGILVRRDLSSAFEHRSVARESEGFKVGVGHGILGTIGLGGIFILGIKNVCF